VNSFSKLTPPFICDVIEKQGFAPTGEIFQLNSYENRVYDIGLEDHPNIIVKFYRPSRWTEKQLEEEHLIMKALSDTEVPIVNALPLSHHGNIKTLHSSEDFHYCFYPKFGGYTEADLKPHHREWLGRTLARLHNVTESLDITHRLEINTQTFGDDCLKSIFEKPYLPDELQANLEDTILTCLDLIDPIMDQSWKSFALHGDCHLGNILWNPDGPTLLDFDDAVIAPPIQDIWMLFHGSKDEQAQQRNDFFKGYHMFRDFDDRSFILTEPLRTLRMIRHTAWIGERFDEEIFKRSFPYYTEQNYWEEFLLSMKEQISLLQEL
jgi:Ser/Thr protein kinase RdoA (MazF antagonist)